MTKDVTSECPNAGTHYTIFMQSGVGLYKAEILMLGGLRKVALTSAPASRLSGSLGPRTIAASSLAGGSVPKLECRLGLHSELPISHQSACSFGPSPAGCALMHAPLPACARPPGKLGQHAPRAPPPLAPPPPPPARRPAARRHRRRRSPVVWHRGEWRPNL